MAASGIRIRLVFDILFSFMIDIFLLFIFLFIFFISLNDDGVVFNFLELLYPSQTALGEIDFDVTGNFTFDKLSDDFDEFCHPVHS
jgi:hypothetical protein